MLTSGPCRVSANRSRAGERWRLLTYGPLFAMLIASAMSVAACVGVRSEMTEPVGSGASALDRSAQATDRPAFADGELAGTRAGVSGQAEIATASDEPTPPPATPTPRGAEYRRLTEPGCCPMPFWSADGQRVLFWYSPAEGAQGQEGPGIYALPLEGGTPAYFSARPAGILGRGTHTTQLEGDDIVVRRLADGSQWRIATGGEGVALSADGLKAAWARERGRYVPGGRLPPVEHYVYDLETGTQELVEVPEDYELGNWTADDAWLMYRRSRAGDGPAAIRYEPETGLVTGLIDGARLRSGRVSPGGDWLAITRTYEPDPSDNGLFIVATDGSGPPRKIEPFGAYRWRDITRLLLVPLELDAGPMTLLQVEAPTGTVKEIDLPAAPPFRIAAGEWSVSPSGEHIAYRSAVDDAIWVVRLPE